MSAPASGAFVCRFIESVCRTTKGEAAGQLIRLRPWQRAIIEEVFTLDGDGRRKYRRGLLGLPRKNGKSMLGAALALYGLVADGEQGAEVYAVAGEREQARIVFGEAKRMVELEPELSNVLKVYRDAIAHTSSGSVFRVLSAESYSKEGLNPSLVVFDEVHVQPDETLWDVMTLGSAARKQPLVLGITTAGFDRATLCGRLYDHGRQGGDPSFFFQWIEPGDQACDWKDASVWAEANPAYGDWLDPADFEAAVRSTSENAFRRYRLNQWTTTTEAWLPYGAWPAVESERRLLDGETVVLGFDGSYSGDSTALVACTLDGHLEVIKAWEKPLLDDDWRVDIAEVEDTIKAACKRLTVKEVACDPYRWQRTMQVLSGEGVPIVEWPTNSPARMVPATQRFYEAVIDHKMTHGGDEVLARHVGNCQLKIDRLGPRIVKEHKMSVKKIDAAVAAVVAFDRASQPDEMRRVPQIW